MFEHRTSPPLSRPEFFRRVANSLLLGLLVVVSALGLGMAGYHFLEKLSWVDAFVNAAMILSGMGPVAALQTTAGKIFAGCYALFSGLVFISVAGILIAPVAHRALHKFHHEPGRQNP
jgi:sterol desaturase/sphingolipid hydroxylase (fatty acid hydroxylase superfamily)